MNNGERGERISLVLNGIITENPVFVLTLGTCPALATTTSVKGAIGMGIAAMLVLIASNSVISLFSRWIPKSVRIPSYIVIIAGFVTLVQMLMQAYLPELYRLLGVYLALITVNCIILGRAESYAGKNNFTNSLLDGVGMGLGFTLALLIMASVREIFGNASFFGITIGLLEKYKIAFLTKAPGGFFVFGVVVAMVRFFSKRRDNDASSPCCLCGMAGGCSSVCNGEGK